MHRPTIHRRVVFDETVEMIFDPAGQDLAALRRAFLSPFDRAAHAVQVLGYEQDDAVIERFLLCQVDDTHRSPEMRADSSRTFAGAAVDGLGAGAHSGDAGVTRGRILEMPADGLSDSASFAAALTRSLRASGVEPKIARCRIVALRVVAILERWDAAGRNTES